MMATITTVKLIEKFQYALDQKWGYILNTWHTQWTKALQNAKISYMTKTYGSAWKNSAAAKKDNSYTAAMYGDRWIGQWVTDCSGLFYWAFKELGGYMYHGSNTMWNKYCVNKGKLVNGKRADGKKLKPGTAVFVLKGTSDRSHVGLYIGNGTVIEASGTKAGVITTEITNSKWCEWGELKGVDYGENEVAQETTTSKSIPVGYAVVNDTSVALRDGPSTSSSILMRVPKNSTVKLAPEDKSWTRIEYNGKIGYMMTKFLNT